MATCLPLWGELSRVASGDNIGFSSVTEPWIRARPWTARDHATALHHARVSSLTFSQWGPVFSYKLRYIDIGVRLVEWLCLWFVQIDRPTHTCTYTFWSLRDQNVYIHVDNPSKLLPAIVISIFIYTYTYTYTYNYQKWSYVKAPYHICQTNEHCMHSWQWNMISRAVLFAALLPDIWL